MGKWIAALIPVPKITAKRVVGSMYAFDNKVAEESLTMASSRMLRCCNPLALLKGKGRGIGQLADTLVR